MQGLAHHRVARRAIVGGHHRPVTWFRAEGIPRWGVAVPFTTPLLVQVPDPARQARPDGTARAESVRQPGHLRVRSRGGAEGGEPRPCMTASCSSGYSSSPPPHHRRSARSALQVALDGAAGRRAAREAEAAIRVDAKVGLMIQLHLVTRLLDEAGLEGIDWRDFADDNLELRSTIKHRLAGVAPGFGRSVDGIFQAIEEIADSRDAASACGGRSTFPQPDDAGAPADLHRSSPGTVVLRRAWRHDQLPRDPARWSIAP